jgi:hypothetical protein
MLLQCAVTDCDLTTQKYKITIVLTHDHLQT